jgi:outer membrane beta-barrel protein
MYPKDRRIEFNVPNLGFIMNQSYVNTLMISGGGSYYFSESWGLGVEIGIGSNSDKAERVCIETFFYDPSDEVGSPCGDPSLIDGTDQNNDGFPRLGPAYVPVREINSIIMANVLWTPVYGKQLLMMSATSYFDLFVEMGLGIASSTFYRKQEVLKNGKVPRGPFSIPPENPTPEDIEQVNSSNDQIGATLEESYAYGLEGRPDPLSENHVVLNLGIGQKFHFGKLFHFKIYIRNMTLIGTAQGFDNLLSVNGGLGVRF